MAKRKHVKTVNVSIIDKKKQYTISQASRILGVSRSYFYYCFGHQHNFPVPVLVNGIRRLTGADIIAIMRLRAFKGI